MQNEGKIKRQGQLTKTINIVKSASELCEKKGKLTKTVDIVETASEHCGTMLQPLENVIDS